MALRIRFLTLLACSTVALPAPAFGQEHQAEEGVHPNHLSLFTGGTTESSDGETSTAFSLGLDYERRISRLVGLGIGGEFVFGGDEREALLGLLLNLHVAGGFILAAGPGLEFAQHLDEHGDEGHAEGEGSETETHPGLRVGLLYEFEVGHRYSIAPSFYTDFIEGKEPTFVWGLAFGVGF